VVADKPQELCNKKDMKKVLLLFAFVATYCYAQAQVIASFSVSDSIICTGQDVTLTYTGQGASLYQWDFGDGTVPSSTINPVIKKNFGNPGTYYVLLSATNGMSTDSAEIFIRVHPKIETNFSLNQSSTNGYYCLGTSLTISEWSNINGYDSLMWDFGDGTTSNQLYPRHTYKATGMHTIKLKVKGFCGDQESSQVVTIVDDARAKPDGGLSINPTEVCPNQLVNVSVWPGNSPLDSLRVYLGDGKNTRLDELEYGYPSVGEYEVMAIAYNGCGIDTSRQKVNVTTSFMRNGNIYFNTDKLCLGQKLRGSVSSYSAIRTVLNYGDGSFDTLSNNNNSFIHAYTKDGSYTVEATFEYMCGTSYTTTRTLTIGTGADILNFSINPFRSQYCLGETAQFNPPWLYLGDTLDVDYGDGNTARFVDTMTEVRHLYIKAGNYMVKAIKSNACGFTKQAQSNMRIVEDAKPYLTITADYNTEGKPVCQGDTTFLSMQAEGYTLENPKFTFEDGSFLNGQTGNKVFDKGEHVIKATAQNMCKTNLTAYFTLNALNHTANPSLSYYYYPKVQCVNQEFFFDVFANGAKSITWDMGDGTTLMGDPNFPHFMYAYNNPGAYTVNITAKNGCGTSSTSSLVNVESGPDMSLTHTDLNINIGDTVRFVNTSADRSRQFWVFNLDVEDTSNATEVFRTYPQKGNYIVSLFGMNEFGCWDTINKMVNVGFVNIPNVSKTTISYVVYPNPSNNLVTIKSTINTGNAAITFTDLTGKLMNVETTKRTNGLYASNVSGLSSGIYILDVKQGNQEYRARIVIQR
jgi:PKD repeat protein